MAGSDDDRLPGFNAPLTDSGPIVSKRTGRRRARVQEAFGAPQKLLPSGRLRRTGPHAAAVEDPDLREAAPERGPMRGIAITLLILVVLGTRGCGILGTSGSDESPVPTPSTTPATTPVTRPATGGPQLVERLPGPAPTTVVERVDATPSD